VATSGATQTSIFNRIVCGIDGTAESLFAARQANRLQHSEGSLLIVVAMSFGKAVHAGMTARHAAGLMQHDAEQAMAEAKGPTGNVDMGCPGRPPRMLSTKISPRGDELGADVLRFEGASLAPSVCRGFGA
jgi:hypothetical protein